MTWEETDDLKVENCIEKLENKARILEEKLAKINNLRKISGKIKTRTYLVETEPDKNGMRTTEKRTVLPKDDFGVELTNKFKLDQLTKLEIATDIELGEKNE